jgi:hypothetical protein
LNRCQQEISARLQTSQAESGDPNIVWDAAGPSKAAPPANEEVTMAKKAKKGEEGEKGEKGQSEEIGR